MRGNALAHDARRGERPTEWWDGTVGYEIYVRSFADANGDGVGDLEGITEKLDHLVWLGVDALWVTPFYPSPGFDHGYDVANYRDVDPIHGTLQDFDDLVVAAHRRGLRVLVDVVPNHTSSHHPWFVAARSSIDDPHRDHYIWRDPAPDGGPPNNWVSHFGGSAWTLDAASGQYWCHLFLPEQPDLNWANPSVRDAFDEVFLFWCERGVDGFRIDVAHGMAKHPDVPDNPQLVPVTDEMGPHAVFAAFEHRHDLDRDDNIDIFQRWHKTVEPYGAALIGEVNAPSPERMARYTREGSLDTVFFLEPGSIGWEPERLLAMHRAMHDADPDCISWILDNHDQARSVSRFGGGEQGVWRSLAVTSLQFALGGVPFLYQGQELGLDNAALPPGEREDPIWTRNHSSDEVGRDVTRHGMPWTSGPTNGFTTGTPWLHAADRPQHQTLEGQRDDPAAPVHRYRELIRIRKEETDLRTAPLEWLDASTAASAVLRRGDVVVVANLGEDRLTVEGLVAGEVIFSSRVGGASLGARSVTIDPECTAVLRSER
jgi:alpha-glucosidase